MNAFVVLLVILAVRHAKGDTTVRTCEPIKVRMCKNIGYNSTGMPNLARHTLQVDADVTLQTFNPLIQYGCSSQLPLFLCSVYVPMCTDKVALPIGPCRGLCESVHARCYPILRGFGFQWPSELDCSLFPAENNHEHMCMEGPGERDVDVGGSRDPAIPIETNPSGTTNPACAKYAKSGSFVAVRGSGSGRCAQYCDAEVLHDAGQRRLAEVWLSTWAALSFACTLAAVAAWLVGGAGDACAGERALALMALCRCAAAAGWGVRAAAGRAAAGCARDAHSPQRLLLAHDGLANPNCAVVFLLLYYFGLAASVWWVVLAGAWRTGVLRRHSAPSAPGAATNSSADRHSSLLQLAAWGAPAALTAAVLVTRDVDADELTGTCFVGNQSSKSLLALVIIPHAVCLLLGTIFLASGMRALLRRRPTPPPALLSTHTSPMRPEAGREQSLLRLGAFAVLYTVPSACILATWMYEYSWREDWLAAPTPSTEPTSRPRPAVWVFLFRIFVSQILGVITAIWVISPKAKSIWRRMSGRLGPQAYKPAGSIKCGSTIPGPPNTPLPPLSVHCYSTHSHVKRPHSHAHKYATYGHQVAGGSYRKPRHYHYSAGETIL